MSLVYYGAAGDTEQQFKDHFYGGKSREEIAILAKNRTRTFPGYRSIASLWCSDRFYLLEDYKKAATKNWQAHIGRAPFHTNRNNSANIINSWYKKQTNGHLPKIISAADLAPSPDIVGLIATAYTGKWNKRYFLENETKRASFFPAPGKKFQVMMMHCNKSLPYYEDTKLRAVRLDYQNNDISLLLLLTLKTKETAPLSPQLNGAYFAKIARNLHDRDVKLHLPKVAFKKKIDWRSALSSTPLKPAFTRGLANFKHLNNHLPQPVFISKLTQETQLKWNERGTTARAVTTFHGDPFGGPPELPEAVHFIANRPFLFFLYNRKNLSVYFMGKISSRSQMPNIAKPLRP